MGSRARRDPAGHQHRTGKGAPTPAAPQNQPAPTGPPPARFVMIAHAISGGLGGHPAFEEELLGLDFASPGMHATIRLPVSSWPAMRESIDKLVEDADAPRDEHGQKIKPGSPDIIVAGAHTNLAAEAEAHKRLKEGPAT